MLRSAVTISLVPQARGGPFVFWDDLVAGCRQAAELGFDGVEIFPPGAAAISAPQLRSLLRDHGLQLAAMGTGAGWLIHKLTLTSPVAVERQRAQDFIRSIIDVAGPLGAPAIIGSMQGRWGDAVERPAAWAYLTAALQALGEHARQYGVPLLYEPLNRYETNLVNRLADGVALLESLGGANVKLLADLFHMNIEEADMPAALQNSAGAIGHLHFVDSNRRPAGCGHLDLARIGQALREIDYRGFASAEALPYPDPLLAAQLTIEAFRKHLA